MNSAIQSIHLAPGAGPAFSAMGDVYRFLATGEQTGGASTLVEARVPPGGGPPPHIHHREDEAFFVIEGEITFMLGGRKIVGTPGTFLFGPRGVPHGFKNEGTATARMLAQFFPSGFEHFMREFAQAVPSFDSAPLPVTRADIARLLECAPRYGVEILPPPA